MNPPVAWRLHAVFIFFVRTRKALQLMWSPRKPRRQEEVTPLRAPVQAGRHQRQTRSKPEERRRPKGTNQQCRLGWMTRHRCDGSLPVRSKPLPHRWRAAAVAMGRRSRLKVIAVNVCVFSVVVCFTPARTAF